VVFSVYPRKGKVDTGEITNPEDRPWGKKYFMLQGAELLGEEGGYYEMPAFAALWKSVSTSKWGRSPAMDVLADILNVNEWQKIQRNAAAKSVDPSILVTDRGLLSDLDLSPGGMTVTSKKDAVTVLESGSRLDFSMEEIRNMEENINQAFMQDRLALKESPAMTATEVAARREFMMRSITQPLAILQRNFLDRMIRRTYRILYRAGQLPEVPDIVRQSNSETDIHYNGPLPRTQKAQVVQSEMQYLQYVMSLKELDPEVDDLIDKDAMLKNIAINLGVPALDLRSEEEVAKIRRERAAAMQQQAELERVQQTGAAMEQLARGTNAVEQVPATQSAIGALQQ